MTRENILISTVTLDSICQMYSRNRNFPKDGQSCRSYSWKVIRYFISENQGKVTCKIGLGDDFVLRSVLNCSLSLHIGLVVPCIYIFKATDPHRDTYMSDLGPARSRATI